MWDDLLLVAGAYIIGAFPLLSLLGRLKGLDLTAEEDLHQALWQKGGRLLGATGLGWDVVKGMFPVLVGESLHFELSTIAIAAIAAVAGQMWSAFDRFQGEKGNTTGLGMALVLAPKALGLALVPVAVGALWRTMPRLLSPSQSLNERLKFGGPPSRSLPLGVLVGSALLPLLAWWIEKHSIELTLAFLALLLLIVLKRLTAGLSHDLKTANNKKRILINRLLYDRSC